MSGTFTAQELRRYARHLRLPQFGAEGQRRLRDGSVLVIGAGGLGSPALLYLAAAGVGRIGIADPDKVDESNLQRQIIHDSAAVGMLKVQSAAERIAAINPNVSVEMHAEAFTAANAADLVSRYDVVLDGSDNFATRYLTSDVCVWQKKPNVYGAIDRWEGQLSVFAPHLGGPCYRCLFPEPPSPGVVPS
jgi:sulfur-carrier protein adenylyltransferase/sulfurtransferase